MSKNQLQDEIDYVSAVLRSLNEATETRDLADDEWTAVRDGLAWLEEAEQRMAQYRRLEDMAAAAQPGDGGARSAPFQIQKRVDAFDGDDVRRMLPAEVRDRALSALDKRESTDHLTDRSKERVDGLLRSGRTKNFDPADLGRRVLLTERPEYRSAFQKGVLQPQPVWTSEEARAIDEFRAMSIGTDSAGGFGVPVFIDPSIILTAQESGNPFLSISRVETITNDAWKGVTSAGVSWSFDAEAAEVSDDSPTLAQPTVTAHMARGFIPYSIEVGGDYPGFAQEMSTLLMAGYDELLVEKFSTGAGDGSNEPFGILTALDANTNVEVTPTTDGSFGYEDINKVWKSLPQKYRRNASWMMHVDVNNEVQSFGDDKLRAQTVDLTAEAVDQIKGKPVYESPYFPEFTGTTGAANILVVGDFRNYLIAQRLGMTIELVPHMFATGNNRPSGQRGWFAYARVGADSVNDLGFRLLQNQ